MKMISRKIIAGNWKMNLDYKSSISLAKKINQLLKDQKLKNDVLLLPDFLSFSEISKKFKRKNLFYGVQDISPFNLGSYTGEIALESLKQLNCSYILVGHSERRKYFFDDSFISSKIKNIISNSNITPILCIGETALERKKGETFKVLEGQLKKAFSEIKTLRGRSLLLAYEPIWAIGSGKISSSSDIVVVHEFIRKVVLKIFKKNTPKDLGILYGGSVNKDNFKEFENLENVSGLLIGGSSLKANDFVKIVDNF